MVSRERNDKKDRIDQRGPRVEFKNFKSYLLPDRKNHEGYVDEALENLWRPRKTT